MRPTLRQNRFISITTSGLLAVGLSSCFQNYGADSLYSKSSQKSSGFTDTTPSSGGSFDGTALLATAALVNSYAGTDSSGNYNGSYGLVINLETSFVNAIGKTTLTDLLNRSTEPSVASMPVELSISEFRIKASFQFGKVVQNKKLMNVMVLRPNMTGVDFASGYIPDTAPLVQTSSRYVYSYGGIEGGDTAIARMTMFFRNTNPYATGFLPNATNATWGQNFPSEADATGNADFMRLTTSLGKILYNICIDPNTNGFICDPAFQNAQSSPQDYLLAIHKSGNTIKKAWAIYPTATGPKGLELCNSNYNGQYSSYTIPNAAGAMVTYDVADKRACDCGNQSLDAIYDTQDAILDGDVIPLADRQKLFDYCIPSTAANQFGTASAKGVPNKINYLNSAISSKPVSPTSGVLLPPATPLNDVTFTSI